MKLKVEKNSVQETLIFPLLGRAQCSQKYPIAFFDSEAVRLVKQIDYDFSAAKLNEFSNVVYGIRQKMLADSARRYLVTHPRATIINLGCGLDTSFAQVDNGRCRWVNLDLSDVMETRRELIPLREREQNLACSALDFDWMERIGVNSAEGVFVISGGVLYYFHEEEVQLLFCTLAQRFPGGGICFDCENTWAVKQSNRMIQNSGNTGSPMYFSVDNAEKKFRPWSRRFGHINNIRQIPVEFRRRGALPSKYKWMFNLGMQLGMFQFVEIQFIQSCFSASFLFCFLIGGSIMKLLVYGAGVIGSYLAHVLCAAGHNVSILARGQRKEELEKNGLIIHHFIQRKTTRNHPRIVEALKRSEHYDAVFAVMQYQQVWGILDDLAQADSPMVVLVGNNLSAEEMEEYIKTHTTVPKTVVFGFQATGGRRENGESVCVRAGAGGLECGLLRSLPDQRTKEVLDRIFQNSKYRPKYLPGMQAWYVCHLALILPICYLCYALDCNLTKASRAQLRQVMDAAREGYELLQEQGVPILPQGDERYFKPGPKQALMSVLLWIMAKTDLGRLAASDHCRNAVTEMHALEDGFSQVRSRTPDFPMPQWDSLRAQMPNWDTL